MTALLPTPDRDARRAFWIQATAWVAAIAAAAAVLAGVDYRTPDPDSALHVAIVSDLAGQPLEKWLAPDWGGHWDRQGPFREHPAGLFLLSWPLVAAGYPASQAPFVVNAVFQALCLLLLQRLARVLGTDAEARAVGWLLQLLPIAFVFRIRANHEQLVLFFYLAALVATEAGRRRPLFFGAAALAAVGALLVKGVFAVLVPASCALWLIWRPAPTPRLRLAAWSGLALASLLTLAAAGGYEHAYRQVTGESFFRPYLGQQLGLAAEQHRSTLPQMVIQKFRNLGWYAGRVLWFAFPWSLACLWLAVPRARGEWRWGTAVTREAVLVVCLAGLYVAALSLSDRRADRYAFPAYYMVGMLGAVAAMRHWPYVRLASGALARCRPLEQVLVWAVTFALALSPLWHAFPKFKIINNY
jgi:4-amino-4-deoxy-L-arabinose transferase-like glycosyltransferase